MAMSDPLGDMLTRIRNGQMARKSAVTAPASKLRENVLEVLKREGYIRGFEAEDLGGGKPELSIELKYHNGEPVIRELRASRSPAGGSTRASRTCRRSITASASRSCRRRAGVMSDTEAREARVGGEVLCTVF